MHRDDMGKEVPCAGGNRKGWAFGLGEVPGRTWDLHLYFFGRTGREKEKGKKIIARREKKEGIRAKKPN